MMTTVETLKLPLPVRNFLRDAGAALGERFIGAFVFGSWAKGQPSDESDLDLAVVVADADADRSRPEVFRALGVNDVDQRQVSLSVETYLRLKEFLKLGDPFAWVVCKDGAVVSDPRGLLQGLQNECAAGGPSFDRKSVAAYLQRKGQNHYAQSMRSMNQVLSNIQLSMMASAQAAAVATSPASDLRSEDLVGLADWTTIKQCIQGSVPDEQLVLLGDLVMAHKNARVKKNFPGSDLMNALEAAGRLWKTSPAKAPEMGEQEPARVAPEGDSNVAG